MHIIFTKFNINKNWGQSRKQSFFSTQIIPISTKAFYILRIFTYSAGAQQRQNLYFITCVFHPQINNAKASRK